MPFGNPFGMKGQSTMPMSLGGGTQGKKAVDYTNWTQSPSQVAQAMGLNPAINPYNGSGGASGPMGQNYGFNTGGNAGGGGTSQAAYRSAAMNDASLASNTPTSQLTGPITPTFQPSSTNPLDDGSVPGTNALGGIAGTTSGSNPSGFKFNGSDTAYSGNDVTNMLSDPQQFMKEFLFQRGMDTPTAESAMGNYYQFLPALASFFMSQGNTALTNPDKMLGIQDQLLSNYTTPGGRRPDAAEMLRQIMQHGTVENGGSPSDMLAQMYAGGDQQTQVQNILGLWQAANGALPGAYGKAIQDAMAQLAGQWKMQSMDSRNAAVGTSNPYSTSFADFLEQDPLARRFAGL